jgi:lipoprotein-anchoring transpeptidase ErfK/SrfK
MKRTLIVSVVSVLSVGLMLAASPAEPVARDVSAAVSVRPVPVVTTPSPSPTASVLPVLQNPDPQHRTGDVIEVSISQQRLTAWRDGRVVMRLVISTGRPGYDTPTGHYRVIAKYPKTWSAPWKVWMPWAMNWYGNYFIHQLPHFPGSSENIGASELGRPASHGCVRVNVGDAQRLYEWTAVGTPVWVH